MQMCSYWDGMLMNKGIRNNKCIHSQITGDLIHLIFLLLFGWTSQFKQGSYNFRKLNVTVLTG